MTRPNSRALRLLALGCLAGPALGLQGQQTLLQAPDINPGDQHGFAVSSSDSWILVGAPNRDDQGSNSGAAYLYDTRSGAFSLKLLASNGGAQDSFGYSVAVDGDFAVVGAPLLDGGATNEGAAYIFDVNTGQELFALVSPQVKAGGRFGQSVSIDGDLVVVGANTHNVGSGGAAGRAYVYRVSTGELLMDLSPLDPQPFGLFGNSIDISQGIVAVGATNVDASEGAAYLFDALTGQQLHKLPHPMLDDGANYARSLAIDGSTLIVGAPEADGALPSSGTAFLFDVGTGALLGQLFAEDDDVLDIFGASVDLLGSTALIGARGDDEVGDGAGAAYLFDIESGQQIQKILLQDAGPQDFFGTGVALSSCGAVVSSDAYNGMGPTTGAAVLQSLCPDSGVPFCDPVPNSTGQAGFLTVVGSLQVALNDLQLIAEQLPPNEFGYLLNGASTAMPVPVGGGNLCLSGGLGRHITGLANSGPSGRITTAIDLLALPRPSTGTVAVQPGETWHFQLWHRDGLSSNLTEGLSLTLD